MSRSSQIKLHDMTEGSSSDDDYSHKSKSEGCHLTIVQGFILTFLALTIAVLVGVIVHFAGGSGQTECVCNYLTPPPVSEEQKWQECLDMSAKKNICLSAPHCQGAPPVSTTLPPGGTTSTATPTPTDVRLPLNVMPDHYDLMLKPDIYTGHNETFSFSGTVSITVTCVKATDVIVMHINKLTIEGDVTIEGYSPGSNAPTISNVENDESRQFLKLHLSGMLTVNQQYIVRMAFTGPLKPDLVGLYWSSYTTDTGTSFLATTQLQPTDARKTFPCFDEPGVKSTFNVTLLRKTSKKTLSNMDIIDEAVPQADGWVADVYRKTVKMSTYLLAFIVCDFDHTEDTTSSGTLFRVWSRPEAVEQTRYALEKGIKTIEFFENYFNISFPLPKQDMIAVPDFAAGAMENWGLIIYRETALLYDEMLSSAGNKQRVAEVVVHELAHQWFGNLVTPVWWDDLWLNEGFASYMEYVGMDVIEPTWDIYDQFVERDLHTVLLIDSLSTSHPIYVPVNHPDEINEIFDRISYLKGASIIRMMNFFLGEDTFTKGLSNYLNKYAYDNSNHTDLWRELGKQAVADSIDIDVSGVMNTWVQQMGYPVVTIERAAGAATAKVSQQHFQTDRSKPPSDKYTSPFGYKWEIPLTFVQKTSSDSAWNDTSTLTWLSRTGTTTTINVDTNSDWLVGNIGQFGYYRVNYDENNWNNLITQLRTDHTVIKVKNRAQIIDDAITIGRSGYLDELIGLRTTEYLDKEDHYVPWKAASDALGYYRRMLQFTQYYGAYKKYILKLAVPHFTKMGLDYDQTTEPHLDKYKRSLFVSLACAYGHQPCRDDVSALFQQWMSNSTDDTIIKPDLKSTVYCNGIRNGGVEEWNFLYEQYKTTNVAAEAARILVALTCSTEPWILNRLLHYTLDANEIRRQDALYVIRDVSYNSAGKLMAWNFFRAKFDTIQDIWGGGFFQLSNTIAGITASFNTQFELDQLLEFKEQNPDLGSGTRAVEQAIEATETNIKWLNDNGDKIGEWLMANFNHTLSDV